MTFKTYHSKLEDLKVVADTELQNIVGNKTDFRKFLDFQANLYKYSFEDALLIYNRNPNATACATYEEWNSIGRYVNKGEKAIDIFTDSNQNEIKKVFDLSATNGRAFKFAVKYAIPNDLENALVSALNNQLEYKIETSNFAKMFREVINQHVAENYEQYFDDFVYDKKGSLMEHLSRQNVHDQFQQTVSDCVCYMLCKKFGVPQVGVLNDETAFKYLGNFNTKELLTHLGNTVNFMAKEVIENVNAILKQERSNKNERANLANKGKSESENVRDGGNERSTVAENKRPQRGEFEGMAGDGSRATGTDVERNNGENGAYNRGRSDNRVYGRADATGEIREHVGDIYGAEPQGQEKFPHDGGLVGRNVPTGGNGSATDERATIQPIQGEISTPTDNAHGNVAMGNSEDGLGGGTDSERDSVRSQIVEVAENIVNNQEEPVKLTDSFFVETPKPSPNPMFFPNWKDVENEIDFNDYQSGDTIGYNKEGVKYSVSKMDNIDFVVTTTGITPWGDVLGADDILADVQKEMTDYRFKTIDTPTWELKEDKTWQNQRLQRIEQDNQNSVITTDNTKTSSEIIQQPTTTNVSQQPQQEQSLGKNFVITEKTDVGLSSGKAKFEENINAIKLSGQIANEQRPAREDEQRILAKFSGFGGIPQAFDRNNSSWANEYTELKNLLSDDQYALAEGSTLNAHFTSTEVIEAMYKGLDRLGFQGGNVLEPSMGVGNFFGMLPQEIADKSRLYGVELDEVTGRIAKQLYPQANIQVKGFETANLQDNFFDVTVGNVPFGNYKVHDSKFNKHNFLIHDYFIANALEKVRQGGIVAVITSKGTMDKENSSFRKYIAERAELVGAIRLPNNAFKQSAGTEVTSDILFLKKRDGLAYTHDERWVNVGEMATGKLNDDGKLETMPLNQYFIDNPQMLLGEMKYVSGQFGKETALLPFAENYQPPTTEERFRKRFHMLKIDDSFTPNQKRMLQNFERNALESGVFDMETFDQTYRNYGGFNRLDEDFGFRLDEIIDYVNMPDIAQNAANLTFSQQLNTAIGFLPKNVFENAIESLDEFQKTGVKTIPADENVKNFCHVVVGDEIYQRENSIMKKVALPDKEFDRVAGLIKLTKTTRNLLDIQLSNCSNVELQEGQEKLNTAYDTFFKKYGAINSRTNAKYFGDDADYPLLSSLENENDEKQITKADIFNKRTVSPIKKIESVETSIEALAVSMNEYGYVNLKFMNSLVAEKNLDEMVADLQGVIFKNPLHDSFSNNDTPTDEFDKYSDYETADEYLSGNVVEKLALAREVATSNPIYAINVQSLESVQPTPLEAQEISVRLGSNWVKAEYYRQFIKETFNPRYGDKFNVSYSELSGNWRVERPYDCNSKIECIEKFGTKRMNAYELMEQMLNQKNPRIYDTVTYYDDEGKQKERRVPNKNETIAIKDRQNVLKEEFKQWIFKDPTRREDLVATYNKKFNSTRERQYDGSHLTFAGMNPSISLRKHQADAIARTLYGGNSLLAHVVGAGKTFTMVASAVEMKRLGLANKPLIVVPKHLLTQWGNDFKKLYPTANVLVTGENDFKPHTRQRFCGRIATGNWDAVIMSHSQFEKIPMSQERERLKLKEQLSKIRDMFEEVKSSRGERSTIKEIGRLIKTQEAKLQKLNDTPRDDLVTFEQLGVDALYVDEAHFFKNKFMFSKMTNIAGLPKTASKKCTDMDMKCEYINELNYLSDKHHSSRERGVYFSTGTPISNSMSEMFTMQSYLQRNELKRLNLDFFDNWASNFGEIISSLELAPSGQGFRVRDRFAKFVNLPELMSLYRQVADIQTAEMVNLPVPKIKGDKAITIAVEASPAQKMIVDQLVERSEKISKGEVRPEVDNMLCIVNEGKLCALDVRALDPNAEDYAGSKVNVCTQNIFDIYKANDEKKLTQMVFCDSSTPNGKNEFSVYTDMKAKLIKMGMKPEQVAFIHDAKTDDAKEKIFSKMRSGELRVLFGSTSKMGSGTNAQTKLFAVHHLDCPYRPSDLSQRDGRIVRQGNENPEVEIYQYVTKSTFDSYLWQIVETKQKFISQVMSGKNPSRTMDDIDEITLNYAEVKAIATGNPLIKRKIELEMQLQQYNVLEKFHLQSKYNLENDILNKYPKQIASLTDKVHLLEQDIEKRGTITPDEPLQIRIGKNVFDDRTKAGELLLQAVNSGKYNDRVIGNYKGFDIIPQPIAPYSLESSVLLKGHSSHKVTLGGSEHGNILRIENEIAGLETHLIETTQKLEQAISQLSSAKVQVTVPFEHETLVRTLKSELVTIDETFNIGKEESTELIIDDEPLEHGKSKANSNTTAKYGTNSNNNAYKNETEENEDYDEYEEDELDYEVS